QVYKRNASHLGTERLKTRVDAPAPDILASRSADGRTMYLKAVNTDLERTVTARISVRGTQVSSNAIVERVVADSLTAVNGFATPDAVKITRGPIKAGNTFSLELPRH